jgi:tetratricopeptide (TPR) repeat protein
MGELRMSRFAKTSSFPVGIFFAMGTMLICIHVQDVMCDDDLLRYEEAVKQKPDDAKAHSDLGIAYAKQGMLDKAIDEFERAMEIEHRRGYEAGMESGIRKGKGQVYGRYLALSIAIGLLISAAIVSILLWSEMADRFKAIRRNSRVKAFVRSAGIRLSPELRDRAIEIARRKEKLRDAISRETDSNLREVASGVLPKLDDLTRQASLLLELQQNLLDHIGDINSTRLERAQRDCEEKLRKETDQEAREALEYQLKQIKNEWANHSKAAAKIRTCDAVLSGIAARIDATALDLVSLPSVLLKKQEFFEKVSAELDEEITLTRDAAETVMEQSA